MVINPLELWSGENHPLHQRKHIIDTSLGVEMQVADVAAYFLNKEPTSVKSLIVAQCVTFPFLVPPETTQEKVYKKPTKIHQWTSKIMWDTD